MGRAITYCGAGLGMVKVDLSIKNCSLGLLKYHWWYSWEVAGSWLWEVCFIFHLTGG